MPLSLPSGRRGPFASLLEDFEEQESAQPDFSALLEDFEERPSAGTGPPSPPEHGVRLPSQETDPYEDVMAAVVGQVPPTAEGPISRVLGAAGTAAAQTLLQPSAIKPVPEAYEGPFRYITGPAATTVQGALQAGELGLKAIGSVFAAARGAFSQGIRELGLGDYEAQRGERAFDDLTTAWIAASGLGTVRPAPGRGRVRVPRTIEEFSAILDDLGAQAAREALRGINDPAFKEQAFAHLRKRFVEGTEPVRGAGARERGLALPAPPEMPGAPVAAPVAPRPAPARPARAEAPAPPEIQPQAVPTPSVAALEAIPARPAPARPARTPELPTVAESPETIQRQIEALERGDKPAVLFPPEEDVIVPPKMQRVVTPKGVIVYNPEAIQRLPGAPQGEFPDLPGFIRRAVKAGKEGLILGYGVEAKPAPTEPATLVEARGPAGEEVQTVLAPTPPPPEVLEAAKRVLPPEGGEVVVTPPDRVLEGAADVIARRLGRREQLPEPQEVGGVELRLNAALTDRLRGQIERAGQRPEVAEQFRRLGITRFSVEPAHRLGLSEQARIDPSTGEIEVSADVTDLPGTVAHELAHDIFNRLSAGDRKAVEDYITKNRIEAQHAGGMAERVADHFADVMTGKATEPDEVRQAFFGSKLGPRPARKAVAPSPEEVAASEEEAARRAQVAGRVRSWEEVQERHGYLYATDDLRAMAREHGDRQVVIKDVRGGRHSMPASVAGEVLAGPANEYIREVYLGRGRSGPIRIDPSVGPPELRSAIQRASLKAREAPEALPEGVSESEVFDRIQAIRRTTEDILSGKEEGRVVIYDPESLAQGRKRPIGAVSGGGKTLDLVAEAFDEVSAVADLSPGKLKENPTYQRLKRAVVEQPAKEQAEGAPQWMREMAERPAVARPTEPASEDLVVLRERIRERLGAPTVREAEEPLLAPPQPRRVRGRPTVVQPTLPGAPQPEIPREGIGPTVEQRPLEETPLFGIERERAERAAKEAQQELPGLREKLEAYDVREGTDAAASRQLALEAVQDLEGTAAQVSAARGAVVGRRLPGRGVPAGAGARTLGLGITADLIRTGRVDLRGQTVRSPEDMARIAQVYRDPRFETFRIIYVKGETIVAHEGVTSRLPGSAQAFVTKGKPGEEMMRGLFGMARRMDRLGADGYWLVHNHPSGRADMSPDDILTTRALERSVPGFKGHVVIDSGEYGVLGPGEKGPKTVPMPKGQPDPLLAPSVPHDLLNRRIRSEADVFSLARTLHTPKGFVTLLYRARDKVRAIQEIPEALFLKTEEAAGYIRGRQRAFGAHQVVAISPAESVKVREAAEALVRSGAVLDYLDLETAQGTAGIVSVREPTPPRGFRVAEAGDLSEDLARYGAHVMGQGAKDFASWSERMVRDLGGAVRPHLQETYRQLMGWPAGATPEPTGTSAFAGTKTMVPTAQQPTPAAAGKPGVGTGDVVEALSKAFNVPIRVGHFRRPGALGIYKHLERVARTKGYGDIAVAAHEVAHHVDKTTNILSNLTKEERRELRALDYRPKRGKVDEGFAEFVRHYLTTDEAGQLAPNFHAKFTSWLPQSGLADAFASSRAVVDQWRGQGSLERIKAQIAVTGGRFAKARRVLEQPRDIWHLFVDNFYNRLGPLKRTAEEMAGTKQVLEAMPPEALFWPFAKASNMAAAAKARNMALHGMADVAGNKVGPGLVEILSPIAREVQAPETLHDWYAYAYARHALDVIARGKEPGIKAEDAQAAVAQFDGRPGWKDAADGLTKWHRQLIDYLVDAGGLSQELADLFQRLYPNYISLARHIEDVQGGPGGPGGRYANLPSPIRRLKGSGRPILPPLETALIYAERIVGLADKMRVGKMLIDAAEHYGKLGEIAEQVSPDLVPHTFTLEKIKDQLEKLGADLSGADLDGLLKLFENNVRPDPKDNILVLWRNGKREAWRLRDDLYRAMLALDKPFRLPKALDVAMGSFARAIRLGATGLRPGFSLITNPLRDIQTAVMQTEAQYANPASTALGAVRGMLKDLTGDELAKIYKRGGGQMAQPLGIDRRFLKEAIQEILAQDPKSKVLNWARHPVDSLRALFSVPELGPRLAEFEAELKRLGWKPGDKVTFEQYVKAQVKAQNVTVDFREGGNLSMWLNQVIPFFNATVQGPHRMADIIRRRPWDVLRRGLLWLTLPTLALWWAYKDEDWYKDLPPYERYRYWHIRMPNGAVLRIPKPFEWGHLFGSIPEAAVDWAYRQDKTAMKEALKRTGIDLFPPFIPGAFEPAIEIFANHDLYFDRPLIGKSLERLPPEQQFYPRTTETAKAIGRLFGVSPIYVEHLVGGYTGGLGQEVLSAVEYGARAGRALPARGTRPPTAASVPVVGRLFLRPETTRVFEDFYQKKEELEEKQAGAKATRALFAGRDRALLRRMRDAAERMADIRKRTRQIVDSDAPDDEKRRRLTTLHERMVAVAKRAMGKETYSGRRLPARRREEPEEPEE